MSPNRRGLSQRGDFGGLLGPFRPVSDAARESGRATDGLRTSTKNKFSLVGGSRISQAGGGKVVREFSVMAALRGCDFLDLRGGKRPFRNLVTTSQDDGQRQELAAHPHCAWLRVDRAKRIVTPLRGFPVFPYRVPTAVAVGYAVPPLTGLDKEKREEPPLHKEGWGTRDDNSNGSGNGYCERQEGFHR